MAQYAENKPTADVLMLSMRSMGYTFEAAIADIVDNSISAGASEIQIRFPVDPTDLFVAICDNGSGMNRDELFDAMKYGSSLKRGKRLKSDLGRFGLGLKSASLSQCRNLTVVSKKDGMLSAFTWNLDVVEEKKDWIILERDMKEIQSFKFIDYLYRKESGTIVIWEDFDIIKESSGNVYAELLEHQSETSDYLSLIFHRYLNKTGVNRLTIRINEYALKGLDPFLENHPKTTSRLPFPVIIKDKFGEEQKMTVQVFVLPFQKDLSPEDKKSSGGIENYRTKQGFYIYRNERLIIWGTWFGRQRDELTKYARIRVDIPNTLDEIWGIDIKKQNAKIPSTIRKRLTRAVDEAMDISVKKQTYRGRIAKIDENTDYIWDRKEERGIVTYQINRNSRIFDLLKDKIDDVTWGYVNMVLDEIEGNIPYQQIYIDKSQNKVDEQITDEQKAEIADKARILIAMAKDMGGDSFSSIIERLWNSEPFNKVPELKNMMMEEYPDD